MPRTKEPIKRKPGMLKGISFDEVSFVGKGANQGACVSIIKVDDPKEIAKRMFSEVLEERLEGKERRDFANLLYVQQSALEEVVGSIVWGSSENKKQAIFESLQQFVQTFTSTVNDTDVIKSLDDLKESLGVSENPNQEVNTMHKSIEFYKAMAQMNDEQKEIFKSLTDEEQADFLKAADTDEKMKEKLQELADKKKGGKTKVLPTGGKKKDDLNKSDETFQMNDGTSIHKSEMGDAAFLLLKGMNQRLEASEKATAQAQEIAKSERDQRILKEASDEAETRWPNLPGTPVEKGKTLMAIRALPEEIQKTQLAMLDSGNSSNTKLFKEHGTSIVQGTASEKLQKMAEEHAKATGVTFHKAYDAILDTPEGKKLYEETLN